MIVLDFDRVLFNFSAFKRDYARVFVRSGVPLGLFEETYQAARERNEQYTVRIHVRLVKKHMPLLETAPLMRKAEAFAGQASRYVYRDARPFLTHWKRRGERLALVSHGAAFQRRKVHASGLLPFFRPAVITNAHLKIAPLAALEKTYPVVFLDDKLEIVDAAKERIPGITVIHIVRGRGLPKSRKADAVFSNLTAAQKFIEQLFAAQR
ncbi:MAG: hypothetical protein AAB916_01640 [Patescibacteria group bacterium]